MEPNSAPRSSFVKQSRRSAAPPGTDLRNLHAKQHRLLETLSYGTEGGETSSRRWKRALLDRSVGWRKGDVCRQTRLGLRRRCFGRNSQPLPVWRVGSSSRGSWACWRLASCSCAVGAATGTHACRSASPPCIVPLPWNSKSEQPRRQNRLDRRICDRRATHRLQRQEWAAADSTSLGVARRMCQICPLLHCDCTFRPGPLCIEC